MNKKIFPLAALVAMAGGMNAAQAVNVNADGLGEVLIYPFYTAETGQDTNINLVNTTNETKAIKVRFREAMNTAEVLDFNLYLSPFDHWSAVITADATGAGAVIRTADTSCTVPNSLAAITEGVFGPSVAFRNFEYVLDSVNGVDRTNEGYLEVLEMGVVTDPASQAAILHTAGLPGNCSLLESAFGAITTTAATGGLYGYASIIDVQEGTMAAYDAVAIDNWTSGVATHTLPGSANPNLGSGDTDAIFYDTQGAQFVDSTMANGLDAVSAVLMHDTLANDFVLEPSILAGTDWVITFPTKRPYVNVPGATPAQLAPFTVEWDPAVSRACEVITLTFWDREERTVVGGLDFSPLPTVSSQALCYEANVLTFAGSNVLEASSRINTNTPAPYSNGWARIDFSAAANGLAAPARELTGAPNAPGVGTTFNGLPVVGFAVQKYSNGTLTIAGASVLSNYAGTVLHKTTTVIAP